MPVPSSNRVILPLAVLLAFAMVQTASARIKKHRVERSVPAALTVEHGTPIIMQGLAWPKSAAPGERGQPQRRVERPRTVPRGSSGYVPQGPLPTPPLSQPSAIDPYQTTSYNDLSVQLMHY